MTEELGGSHFYGKGFLLEIMQTADNVTFDGWVS